MKLSLATLLDAQLSQEARHTCSTTPQGRLRFTLSFFDYPKSCSVLDPPVTATSEYDLTRVDDGRWIYRSRGPSMGIGRQGRSEVDLALVVVVVETTENPLKLQKWEIGVS